MTTLSSYAVDYDYNTILTEDRANRNTSDINGYHKFGWPDKKEFDEFGPAEEFSELMRAGKRFIGIMTSNQLEG